MWDFLKGVVSFFLDTLQTIVMGLAIFVVVYLFLFQPHQVKGNSMLPNFRDAEYILTDKISYRFKTPQRGDVIVFKSPKNPEVDFIKRIIALPLEKVRLTHNGIYINDKKLQEIYEPSTTLTFPGMFLKYDEEYIVSKDSFFVLGDNREHSSDSREWGPVPFKNIIGKTFFRYWPIPKIGFLTRAFKED